jgi:hypothetical protein
VSALIINFRFRVYFLFFICVITIMADEPFVVMAEPLESARDRDAASYRDASMRQLEMFLDKAKRGDRGSAANGAGHELSCFFFPPATPCFSWTSLPLIVQSFS